MMARPKRDIMKTLTGTKIVVTNLANKQSHFVMPHAHITTHTNREREHAAMPMYKFMSPNVGSFIAQGCNKHNMAAGRRRGRPSLGDYGGWKMLKKSPTL